MLGHAAVLRCLLFIFVSFVNWIDIVVPSFSIPVFMHIYHLLFLSVCFFGSSSSSSFSFSSLEKNQNKKTCDIVVVLWSVHKSWPTRISWPCLCPWPCSWSCSWSVCVSLCHTALVVVLFDCMNVFVFVFVCLYGLDMMPELIWHCNLLYWWSGWRVVGRTCGRTRAFVFIRQDRRCVFVFEGPRNMCSAFQVSNNGPIIIFLRSCFVSVLCQFYLRAQLCVRTRLLLSSTLQRTAWSFPQVHFRLSSRPVSCRLLPLGAIGAFHKQEKETAFLLSSSPTVLLEPPF